MLTNLIHETVSIYLFLYQINGLQQLTGENGNLLTRNYRPVQPTNGREVIFRP